MRVLDICLKDLKEMLGDPRVLLFLVGMPLVFTLFMGFAYRSGTEGEVEAQRLELGWLNQDPGGALAQALHEQFAGLEGIVLVDLTEDDRALKMAAKDGWDAAAREAVRSNRVAGALLVPANYSEREGEGPYQLTLIADQGAAEGRALAQTVRGPVTRVESAAEIARMAAAEAQEAGTYSRALQDALAAWENTDTAALVSLQGQHDAEAFWYGDNPYNIASPGILVQFAIMALVTSANVLLAERKAGTLQRMATTSLARWQILLGHALGMLGITLLQVLLLVVFGQLVLGVDYLRAPLATLLVSLALSLWVGGLGLTIGLLAKDDSQVVLFALMAMFVLSALGGTWFPLDLAGGTFSAIGRALPSGLAMTGYQNILIRGMGLASVWTPVLGQLAWAAVTGTIAWVRFRREV